MAGEVERLQELVDKYDNIVFFGGAGVSTESGIPDFRSQEAMSIFHNFWYITIEHTSYPKNS